MRETLTVIGRELMGRGSLERLAQDVRFGLRAWARAPGLTGLVAITLALGIGATTAVFSIVQAVLLRPLPYRDPGRLVAIWDGHLREPHLAKVFASYNDFDAWTRHAASFEQLAATTWATGEQILTGRGPAKVVLAVPATEGLFPLLGVRAALGRTFQPDDHDRGCRVVLAHHFWQQTLGGRASAIGDSLTLGGRACVIVGVMPAAFEFLPREADLWRLIARDGEELRRAGIGVAVFGRLKPDVSRETARAEVAALHRRVDNPDAHQRGFGPTVYDLHGELTWLAGRNLRLTLLVLFVAVVFVLLIACVNVANLLLGRAMARQREFALRAALGSGGVRLVRQMLTEGLLLASAGAALGALLAVAAVRVFTAANPVEMPIGSVVGVDLRVLAFAAILAVLTALLFGLAPAVSASRTDVTTVLKSGGRTSSTHPVLRTLGNALVVAETTCSVVLLAGAALLIESVGRMGATPLGFNPDDLLTMTVRLPEGSYADAGERAGFFDRVLASVAGLPGVDGAALSTGTLRGGSSNVLAVRGRPEPSPDAAVPDVSNDDVSVEYFRVMGVPLRAGRWFEEGDRHGSEAVAVVNDALTRKYFPNEPAVGRYVRYGSTPDAPWLRIVGVVGTRKGTNVNREMAWVENPVLFRPLRQTTPRQAALVLRAPASAGDLGRAVPSLVARLDPDVPVGNLETMRDGIAKTLAYPTFRARLLGGFAALALLLAGAGLFGVLSQLVAQRTQEIGIRVALGAQRRAVLALVARQGALLAGTGLAAGLAIALCLGRFLGAMLYGVRSTDPASLTLVASVLALTAVVATLVPARRALRIDPIVALRQD